VFAAEVEAVTTDALLFKRMVLLKFIEPVLMHIIKSLSQDPLRNSIQRTHPVIA
jgi:hypothetical protein